MPMTMTDVRRALPGCTRLRAAIRTLVGASALFASACAPRDSVVERDACDSTPDANRARVLAFYRDGLVNRNPRAAFAQYMAADFVEHKPDVATGTRDSTAAFLERLMQELPEARWQVHRSLADGDMVVVHASFTPAPGAPAYALADVFRLKQCKLVEHWDVVGPPVDHPLNPHTRF